jgi:hypothetical protein
VVWLAVCVLIAHASRPAMAVGLAVTVGLAGGRGLVVAIWLSAPLVLIALGNHRVRGGAGAVVCLDLSLVRPGLGVA